AQLDWQSAHAVGQCLREDVPLQPEGIARDGWTVAFDDLARDVDYLAAILRQFPLHRAVVDVGIARRHRWRLMPQELLYNALRHVVIDHPRAHCVAEAVRVHAEQYAGGVAHIVLVSELVDCASIRGWRNRTTLPVREEPGHAATP